MILQSLMDGANGAAGYGVGLVGGIAQAIVAVGASAYELIKRGARAKIIEPIFCIEFPVAKLRQSTLRRKLD